MSSLTDYLNKVLQQQQADHLYRTPIPHHGPQQPYLQRDGRHYLSFCSNDYLGLASDPRLQAAFSAALPRYGLGSGAAHLVTGHSDAHQQLEQTLAALTGRERVLLFSTGYMANMGTLAALVGRQDTVFADRLNHASLVDGALLSRARLCRYQHHDVNTLARQLAHTKQGHKLIVSDGVFSMDGDLAPLPALLALAAEHDAWLMIDDAHGLGVIGATGRGTEEYYQRLNSIPILVGTLGKAFGTFGAFVAGSEALIETLIQTARSYIYTTALPPALAEATCLAVQIAQTETERRDQLQHLIQHFRAGAAAINLPLLDSITPIQGVLLGSAARALEVSQALAKHAILVTAIRPPTVPPNTARLRITFSALHTTAQVTQLLNALQQVMSEA